jgi:hypothetical protein
LKTYPSIPRCPQPLDISAYVFTKYDGSNLRFEWSRKTGWYKFGTRHRMIDKTDRAFGSVIKLFKTTIGPDLESTLRSNWPGARSFLVFCEYFGQSSFAGQHVSDEPKELRLIDVNPFQQGIIGPEEFIQVFGDKPYAAKFLGEHLLDANYIDSIRNAESIEDTHYEGVIAKWGERHNLQMTKIKTLRWLNDVKLRFGDSWEKYE